MSTITQIDENTGGEGVSGTHLPQTRIRVIMKTSPDLLNISNEALFAMTKAAELFIESLVTDTFKRTRKAMIEYADLAEHVREREELEFLHEMIPKKVKYEEVMQQLGMKK